MEARRHRHAAYQVADPGDAGRRHPQHRRTRRDPAQLRGRPESHTPVGSADVGSQFNAAAFARTTLTYGTAPRNPLVGPGLSAADFTFSKSFRTRERDRIEFRFEAFNALNTPQFGNPGSTLSSTNFDRITGTKVYNREMQAALKYVF